jgi:hypothetical protein
MDSVLDLDQLASEMFEDEKAMKCKLEEFRKVLRNSSKVKTWENLPLVASKPADKRFWVSAVVQDETDQKKMKQAKLSEMFIHGPSQNSVSSHVSSLGTTAVATYRTQLCTV